MAQVMQNNLLHRTASDTPSYRSLILLKTSLREVLVQEKEALWNFLATFFGVNRQLWPLCSLFTRFTFINMFKYEAKPNLYQRSDAPIHLPQYHLLWVSLYIYTRISGHYAPFILAPAEGSVARTRGLALLAGIFWILKDTSRKLHINFHISTFLGSAPSPMCLQSVIMESKRTLEVPERTLSGFWHKTVTTFRVQYDRTKIEN